MTNMENKHETSSNLSEKEKIELLRKAMNESYKIDAKNGKLAKQEIIYIIKRIIYVLLIDIVVVSSTIGIAILLHKNINSVIETIGSFSFMVFIISALYLSIGLLAGVNNYNASMQVSAWTNKRRDPNRSIKDLNFLTALNELTVIFFFGGLLNVLIIYFYF